MIAPLVDWIIAAVARIAVLTVVLAGRVPKAIVQIVGEQLLKIPVLEATSAVATATLTAIDTLGHTLATGAQITIEGQAFVTTADATITAGQATATVPIQAINAGAAGTGLQSPASLQSPTVTWLSSVTLPSPTTGGVDGETPDEYVDRFADETPTLSTKAILLPDFEAIARRDLEVFRAMAIDNFVPPATSGVEGAVTVAVQPETGTTVSGAGKTRVETALEAERVLNIDVYVIDPTYTQVDVAFTFTVRAGYDAASVKAEAEAAVSEFLSPTRWGVPPAGSANAWVNEPTVVRNDLFGAIYRVAGVRHVTALTLGAHGGALSAADLALTGAAPLPQPMTITGTPA